MDLDTLTENLEKEVASLGIDNSGESELSETRATIEDNVESEVEPEASDDVELQLEDESIDNNDVIEEEPKGNAAWAKMRKQLKEEQERRIALEQKMSQFEGYMQGQQSVAPQQPSQEQLLREQQAKEEQEFLARKPDMYDDPEAYENWMEEKLERKLNQTIGQKVNNLENSNKQYEEQFRIQQARAGLKTLEDDYAKIDPEYYDAKQFLIDNLAKEYKVYNPNASDYDAKVYAENQELLIASQAYNNQHDPVKTLRDLANTRGYTAKPQVKTTTDNSAVRRKTTSLVGKAGAAPRGDLKLDDFAGMDLNDLMNNEVELEKRLRSLM